MKNAAKTYSNMFTLSSVVEAPTLPTRFYDYIVTNSCHFCVFAAIERTQCFVNKPHALLDDKIETQSPDHTNYIALSSWNQELVLELDTHKQRRKSFIDITTLNHCKLLQVAPNGFFITFSQLWTFGNVYTAEHV